MRVYNPIKQGYDQDPNGVFVRAYISELANVPDALIREPWRWAGADGLLERTYPSPILNNAIAAKEVREALYLGRKGAGHRETAQLGVDL